MLTVSSDLTAVARAVRQARRGVSPAFEEGQLGDDQRDELVHSLPLWVASRKGWLYIAHNEAWPATFKIGCSRRGVPQRLAALSGTAVLTPWRPMFVWSVYDAHGLESLCKANCRSWWVRGELFEMPLASMEAVVRHVILSDKQMLLSHLHPILLPGELHDLLTFEQLQILTA